MRFKTLILDGDDGVSQVLGYVIIRGVKAIFRSKELNIADLNHIADTVGAVLPIHVIHGGCQALICFQQQLKFGYIGIDVVFYKQRKRAAHYRTGNKRDEQHGHQYVEQISKDAQKNLAHYTQ